MTKSNTGIHRFPFSNFRYSLTLFSKFFASFPHGTCSLSVSHRYLALDGIYHPLWAAIPSNPTRIKHFYSKVRRGCHPLCRPIPRDSDFVREINKCKKKAQFGAEQISPYADSQDELFPLHSPLLGESWLVSFPRFNDMLKFNRYSYFIWDPKTNERTDPLRQCGMPLQYISTVVPSFIFTMLNHLCTEYNTVVQTTIHLLMFTNDWSRMLCQNHKQFNSANIHAAQSYVYFIAVNEWQQHQQTVS